MARKKKSNNDLRIKIWLFVNMALILTLGVLIAIGSEVVGIAAVASKAMVDPDAAEVTFNLTVDIIKEANFTMNKSIAITVGFYSVVHLVNYGIYLFNKKTIIKVLSIAELLAGIVGPFIVPYEGLSLLIATAISGFIYVRILKLEE